MTEYKSHIPGAGRPKKGFWGFISRLFPERPKFLEPPTPTAQVKPESDNSFLNPAEPASNLPKKSEEEAKATAPKTDEQSGGDDENAPTLSTPQIVKAPTLEENEDNPPTLPTTPPASGGSSQDSSIPGPHDN